MANFISHSILAENLKIKNLNINIIKLFSIGQDLTFSNKECFKKTHNYQTLVFFEEIIKYIIDNKLENDEVVLSFLYGHISHYVFDTKIHPVINDIVCNSTKNIPLEHNLIECYFDIYLLEKEPKYNLDLSTSINEINNVTEMINHIYKNVYGISNVSLLYHKTLNILKRVNKIVLNCYKNTIIKRKIINLVKDEIDQEIIESIYSQSIIKSKEIIDYTNEIIYNSNNLSYLNNIYENISYDTGCKCKKLNF